MSDIQIRRIAGSMGAEIHGVDLGRMDDRTWKAVHEAYLRHIAIFFPEQRISPAEFKEWGLRFGPLLTHPYLKPLEGHAPVHELYKGPAEKLVFGGEWHADFSYLEQMPQAISLYAQIIPEYGGDTLFANRYLAYETLPEPYKKLVDSLDAEFAITDYYEDNVKVMRNKIERQVKGKAVHSIVQVHPETGRKNLFVCPAFIHSIVGMTPSESRPLIDFLVRHATRPDFTARYRWRPGTVGIWDNRASLHYALNDYPGMERRMMRLVVET